MILKGLKSYIADLQKLMRISRADTRLFFVSVGLMAAASFFEAVALGLFIPLLDLMIKGGQDPLFLKHPVLGSFIREIPHARFRYVFVALLGGLMTFVALKNLAAFLSEVTNSKITRQIEHALRVKIYERYLAFSRKFIDQSKIGNITDLATNQVLNACDLFRYFHFFIFNQILLVVYFVMMLWISWRLALTALLFLPLMVFVAKVISKKITVASNQRFEIDQKISATLLDALTNFGLIAAYVREKVEVESYEQISESSRSNFHGIWKKAYFASHALDFIVTLSIGLLLAVCLFVFMKEGGPQIALFFGFFVILRRFAFSFGQIGENFTLMAKSFGPIRKILWVFEDQDKEFIRGGSVPFERLSEKIEFKDVSFSYDDCKDVLKKVSFTLKKGKMTAIVGPTGSGKSTVANLLPRFYDAGSGEILIDSVEIRRYDLASLRLKIAVVDQQVPILNQSIRENLTYGLSGVTQAELDEAAHQSRIYDFISGLPAGYQTSVGDRGVRLSGGEKQRLAIARAILKKPEVFIFDEATSALDMETETQIQKAIEELTRDKTVVAIAHRLSTIRHADQILVLEDGRISEEGSFDELIRREGRFYHYWKLNVFN